MKSPKARLTEALARLLAFKSDTDGRIVAAAFIAFYLLMVAIPRLLWGIDIWPRLGVPRGPSLFFDTRNVMAALECSRLGFDPLVNNPCDPWDRPMVYPRTWLALRWLGLDQSDTRAVAVAIIILFLVSLWFLFRRSSVGQGLLAAVAVCSPAVMFAIQRANMDLAIFVILVTGVLAWHSRLESMTLLSPALVFAAATAKIYPIFAMGAYYVAGKRKHFLTAVALTAAFAVYVVVTLDDILAVARSAPQGEYYSYGARILLARLYHIVVPQEWRGGQAVTQLLAMLPLTALAIVLWTWARRRYILPVDEAITASQLAFFLGALLFLGTFVLGNNFDYRLVFLLLAMPQLFHWISQEQSERRGQLAAVGLTNLLILLWVGALSEYVLLADELVTWTMAGLFVLMLAASIPRLSGLRHLIRPTKECIESTSP